MSRSMQNYCFSVRIWVRSFRLMESLKWPPVELLYGASKFIGYTSNSKWYKSVFWLIERGSYFQTQDERAFLHLLLIVSLHSTYSSIVFNDVLINSSAYLSLSLSLHTVIYSSPVSPSSLSSLGENRRLPCWSQNPDVRTKRWKWWSTVAIILQRLLKGCLLCSYYLDYGLWVYYEHTRGLLSGAQCQTVDTLMMTRVSTKDDRKELGASLKIWKANVILPP